MLKRKEKFETTTTAEDKVLEIDASMQGSLSFKDPVNLMINGNFEGNLDTVGTLTVGENATVKAKIKGEAIVVLGEIIGDIVASKSLEVGSRGRIIGDVETPALAMDMGAILQGQLNMISDKVTSTQSDASSTSFNVDQLASYLSVEKSLIFEWADNGKLPGVRKGSNWQFDKKKVDEWVASGRIK